MGVRELSVHAKQIKNKCVLLNINQILTHLDMVNQMIRYRIEFLNSKVDFGFSGLQL